MSGIQALLLCLQVLEMLKNISHTNLFSPEHAWVINT